MYRTKKIDTIKKIISPISMKKTIYLGSDHGGFILKEKIKTHLQAQGYAVEDQGTLSSDSTDYPQYGVAVAQKTVANPDSLGVLVCGSGVGISMAANKVAGARAVLANSVELATLGRQHNGANIVALGERTTNHNDPLTIVDTFLQTQPDDGPRHERRRAQLDAI
jgi:ribose 5-phosphate isomerase B